MMQMMGSTDRTPHPPRSPHVLCLVYRSEIAEGLTDGNVRFEGNIAGTAKYLLTRGLFCLSGR